MRHGPRYRQGPEKDRGTCPPKSKSALLLWVDEDSTQPYLLIRAAGGIGLLIISIRVILRVGGENFPVYFTFQDLV